MTNFVSPTLDQWDVGLQGQVDNVTGWMFSNTQETDVPATPSATQAWNFLSSGQLAGGGTTQCSSSGGAIEEYFRASDFGFNVPAGATILGVEVQILWENQSTDFTEDQLRLAWGASAANLSTNNNFTGVTLPAAGTVVTYGSPTDLWGETSATLLAQVNSSDFGVVVRVDRGAAGASRTVGMDYVQMRVHYSATEDGNARATQVYAEVLGEPQDTDVLVTQVYAEVIGSTAQEVGNFPRVIVVT